MNEPIVPPPTMTTPQPAPSEKPAGFLQNLIDVYFAPREAFTRIVRDARFLVPAAAFVVVSLAFTAVWMSRMDPNEFIKTQLEESGQWDKIPAEQRTAAVERGAGMMKIFGWVGPIVAVVVLVVVGGVLFFVFRFFYGSEMSFPQALAVTSWTFLAVGLVTSPLTLAVMGLKGDWNLNPQDVVQANLSLLLDKSTAAKPLWAFLSSMDLFSLWEVFLLAVGFGVASRKTTGSALWGVLIPWAIIVLGKVGWAAIF
jgi:hypothetical protein